MSFIFTSPHFPESYWLFCQGLKNNGVNVLAIANTSYNSLSTNLKNSINSFHQVSSLENCDEILRVVVWFVYKHGKIDWIESNNEYWLRRDAALCRDSHVEARFPCEAFDNCQSKHRMKESFTAVGLKTAHWQLTTNLEDAQKSTELIGYPIVIKLDIGVGASDTHKTKNGDKLRTAFAHGFKEAMIMKEYINGSCLSFDDTTNSKKELLFVTSYQYTDSIMDAVNKQKNIGYYSYEDIPVDIVEVGIRSVKTFDTRSRFPHFEPFHLLEDQPVGEKGDIIGLEANTCPPGGFLSDMTDRASDNNAYQLRVDMIAHDTTHYQQVRKYSLGFIGRRDRLHYAHTTQDIQDTYRDNTLMIRRLPAAPATAIGDEAIVACFRTEEEILDFFRYVQE